MKFSRFPSMFAILVFSLNLSAQIPKHEIGFEGGPNFSYRYIKATPKTQFPEITDKHSNVSFCVGLLYQKHYNLRHSFRTGITYEHLSRRSAAGYDSAIVFGPKYLSVPLLYQFSIVGLKAKLYFNTGFSIMAYLPDRKYYDGYHTSLGFITSLGFKYNIGGRFDIGIEVRNNQWLISWSRLQNSSVFKQGGDLTGMYYFDYFRNHTSLLVSVAYKLGGKTVG